MTPEWASYLEWVHATHGGWIKHEQRYADGTKPEQAVAEWEAARMDPNR